MAILLHSLLFLIWKNADEIDGAQKGVFLEYEMEFALYYKDMNSLSENTWEVSVQLEII